MKELTIRCDWCRLIIHKTVEKPGEAKEVIVHIKESISLSRDGEDLHICAPGLCLRELFHERGWAKLEVG